ncbi:hypothetical protein FACS1894110_00650 [Spirochaetia bacterium]|nr:hypothetical protein FACS1894110_00650 [Spirochaetia bacterium]
MNNFDPNAPAWWISPQGKILTVEQGSTHIQKVIDNPNAFGYTTEQIEDIYHSYGEAVGTEKKAREEIIRDILSKGWIRIRKNGFCYSFQLNALSEIAKNYIFDWATRMVDWVGPLVQVNINTKMGDEGYSISDIAGGALGKEASEQERNTLVPISSVFDF